MVSAVWLVLFGASRISSALLVQGTVLICACLPVVLWIGLCTQSTSCLVVYVLELVPCPMPPLLVRTTSARLGPSLVPAIRFVSSDSCFSIVCVRLSTSGTYVPCMSSTFVCPSLSCVFFLAWLCSRHHGTPVVSYMSTSWCLVIVIVPGYYALVN